MMKGICVRGAGGGGGFESTDQNVLRRVSREFCCVAAPRQPEEVEEDKRDKKDGKFLEGQQSFQQMFEFGNKTTRNHYYC